MRGERGDGKHIKHGQKLPSEETMRTFFEMLGIP
jgi:hypothetical protein